MKRSAADPGRDLRPAGRIAFRIMLSAIFIAAGLKHLLRTDAIIAKLQAARLGYLASWVASPRLLVLAAGVGLLVGGLALLAGYRTRWAALLLIVLIIPITITVQVGQMETAGPLFKNIAITGALIYFATHGADVGSLDRRAGRTVQS